MGRHYVLDIKDIHAIDRDYHRTARACSPRTLTTRRFRDPRRPLDIPAVGSGQALHLRNHAGTGPGSADTGCIWRRPFFTGLKILWLQECSPSLVETFLRTGCANAVLFAVGEYSCALGEAVTIPKISSEWFQCATTGGPHLLAQLPNRPMLAERWRERLPPVVAKNRTKPRRKNKSLRRF